MQAALILHLIGLGLVQALGKSYASADGPVRQPFGAPEQEVRRGHPQRPLDGRTDVFALGMLLWEAFTGTTPLSQTLGPGGASSAHVMTAEQLPVELSSLLQRMIEPEAALRPSMEEVAQKLTDTNGAMFAATMAGAHPGPAGSVHVSLSGTASIVRNWERYEILELLGRGGMGAVYKARDRRLGREVALKFILGDDPQMIGRFMQEARAQARIDHDNICKVYETGEVEGRPYIAMQLVDGIPLDKASRAMSVNETAQLIHDAAKALHAAHELGIVHRDIKPSNIMVERENAADGSLRYRPIIMDFGLARESNAAKGLTETGAVMGTPHYMSPEQARGDSRKVDRRSDVYSLGATMYELLTGEPPFSADTVFNILQQVLNQSLRPPRSHNPAIPAALDTIVCKSLNKERSQRYQTALALAEDLARFLSAQRITAKRLSYLYRIGYWARHKPAIAALTVALFLSALGLFGYGIQTRIESARKKIEAEHEAALARRLGQTIKDFEWRMRTAYLLPLHNADEEKALVREQMAQLERELSTAGAHGVRLAHYARGRGHLSLHEWEPAQKELLEAERLGLVDLELDYALGRVLGERYSIALEEARKSGDKTFLEKRKKELEQEFLLPARKYLERSRALKTVAPNYVEALVDYYHQRYDSALLTAWYGRGAIVRRHERRCSR